MNPQGTYPQGEREDFQEWKERELYYEAQASNKPRERKPDEKGTDRNKAKQATGSDKPHEQGTTG